MRYFLLVCIVVLSNACASQDKMPDRLQSELPLLRKVARLMPPADWTPASLELFMKDLDELVGIENVVFLGIPERSSSKHKSFVAHRDYFSLSRCEWPQFEYHKTNGFPDKVAEPFSAIGCGTGLKTLKENWATMDLPMQPDFVNTLKSSPLSKIIIESKDWPENEIQEGMKPGKLLVLKPIDESASWVYFEIDGGPSGCEVILIRPRRKQ